MVSRIVGHADEVGDVLVNVVVFHMHVLDLGAGTFRLLSVGILGSELFQELVPGVLVIEGSWIVGPYPHAIFPITDFFSCDE